MDNQPLVSIILPVYNGEQFLDECLESLASQTHQNLEIIAIDDASKDKTFQILKKWHKKDKRIRLVRNIKRYGLSVSLNRALKKAKGDYLAFMDQNDTSLPLRIHKQVSFLEAHKKTVALGCQYTELQRRHRAYTRSSFPLIHDEIYHALLVGLSFKFETIMISRLLLPKDILKFPTDFYTFSLSQRHSLYINLLLNIQNFGEFANLSDTLYRSRNLSPLAFRSFSYLRIFFMWLKSFTLYDYRPSLRTLFQLTRPSVNT